MTQAFRVYQSLWATERRRPDGAERTLDEKLRMIIDAGFDGAGVRFIDPGYVAEVTGVLRAHGLTWQAQCYPQTIDDLRPVLALVRDHGADHVNLQPDVRPYDVESCLLLSQGWTRLAEEAGVALNIETYRNRQMALLQ
jgi:sugar phosphate isomerase/epimerase